VFENPVLLSNAFRLDSLSNGLIELSTFCRFYLNALVCGCVCLCVCVVVCCLLFVVVCCLLLFVVVCCCLLLFVVVCVFVLLLLLFVVVVNTDTHHAHASRKHRFRV